jgi:hypothetical protein
MAANETKAIRRVDIVGPGPFRDGDREVERAAGIYRACHDPVRKASTSGVGRRYHRPGCCGPRPVLVSLSTSRSREPKLILKRGTTAMTETFVTRTRRLVLTVGPLAAIALSLAAGWKW